MPGLMVSAHAQVIEIVVLQHGGSEKPSQMCEIQSVWSCPMWPSRWGMHISIDWPRLKSCQAACDECTRWEICSSHSQDGGCFTQGLHQALTTPLARLPGIARNDHRATIFVGRSCPPNLYFDNSGNKHFRASTSCSLHTLCDLDFERRSVT